MDNWRLFQDESLEGMKTVVLKSWSASRVCSVVRASLLRFIGDTLPRGQHGEE